jgi:thiol-disulfide isomerase/thioredoxin
MSQRADAQGGGIGASLVLGIATGLLWAPCAGPILGLVLTGAALQGASATTTLLLLAYALGAATSLGLALLIGGRLFRAMKRSLGVSEWIRRAVGAAVLIAVAAIALGADTGFLSRASLAGTNSVEQGLLERFAQAEKMQSAAQGDNLAVEGVMPPLDGAVTWLNSAPLTREQLKGKVVLVDFWTYSCINCLRSMPYVRAWAEKYRDQGLVVIGVHTPEFAFEKDVETSSAPRPISASTYPIAVDNDYAIWRAFKNHYWPAHYFIDAQGRIRHHHYGEGELCESERVIQALLAEAHPGMVPGDTVKVHAAGAEAAAGSDVRSPETYIGYAPLAGADSPGGFVRDKAADLSPGADALNRWSLVGQWTIGAEKATFRPGRCEDPLPLPRARSPPGAGFDRQAGTLPHHDRRQGAGGGSWRRIPMPRAMASSPISGSTSSIRQKGAIGDRTFAIEFLDPAVEAFAFTFG